MNDQNDKKKYSRLRKHLGLLGLEEVPADELQEERQLVEAMRLPPLNLEQSKTEFEDPNVAWWKGRQWQTALALVALLALMVFAGRLGLKEGDAVRVKGQSSFNVWYQRGEDTKQLSGEEILRAGDRFRVEVKASEPVKAYLIVVDNKTRQRPLGQDVIDSAIELAAGEVRAFEQTFVLTDPNLNETVYVVSCAVALAKEMSATQMRELLWQAIQGKDISGCQVKQRTLR